MGGATTRDVVEENFLPPRNPSKTKMAMENLSFEDVYFLLKMEIFHCHVSFRECIFWYCLRPANIANAGKRLEIMSSRNTIDSGVVGLSM